MIIDEITGGRFEEFDVLVIPRQRPVVEPSAIKPIALIVDSTACPLLNWFRDWPVSVGGIVDLTSVIVEVLIVLVLRARDAQKESRIQRLLMR